MGQPGYLGILLCHALLGVDEDEAYVRAFNGHLRPQDAVTLNALVNLGFLAHPGGVNKDILAGFVLEIAVNGIPGRTGNVADNGALLAKDAVGEGGLAYVGLADNGNLDAVGVLFLAVLRREVFDALIQQISGAVAVDGGDRDRISHPQVVELVKVRVHRPYRVHLVYG